MVKATGRVSAIRRKLLLCLIGAAPVESSCVSELQLAVKLAAVDYVNFAVDAWADSVIADLSGAPADDANSDGNSAG